MKTIIILLALILTLRAAGQDDTVSLDEIIGAAQEWASNNLDDSVLKALQNNTDRDQVKEFLAKVQQDFQGTYVLDLAQLRAGAKTILPILERDEETRPYALWLKTRLDYFDTADELRFTIPPPEIEPGKPPPPVPTPQKIREIWIEKISGRPAPAAANPLVAELKPIFAGEKIPPQLVWLAEVESSFDPRARSPAGAAGLFQLMPATAKRFGLSARPVDQRLDSRDSARAAAKYLGALHERFQDWRLALAAYNAGEGTVQKLLEGRKTKNFNAISARLPAETQLYVPKVEAVLLKREGVKLEQLGAS